MPFVFAVNDNVVGVQMVNADIALIYMLAQLFETLHKVAATMCVHSLGEERAIWNMLDNEPATMNLHART
jgi:hypothetical protein